MIARLFVNSHRNGVPGSDGNMAAVTLGIVSPRMIQNANMPPKALELSILIAVQVEIDMVVPTYKANWAT